LDEIKSRFLLFGLEDARYCTIDIMKCKRVLWELDATLIQGEEESPLLNADVATEHGRGVGAEGLVHGHLDCLFLGHLVNLGRAGSVN